MNQVRLLGALAIWVVAMTGCLPVMAQSGTDSLLRVLYGQGPLAWQVSDNPLFRTNVQVKDFAAAGIQGKAIGGNFKRPQNFLSQRTLAFGARGLTTVTGWKIYGEFDYGKHQRDSVKYANVARPYEGNPFITGDATGGNWAGDALLANLQISSPAYGKWQSGLSVTYNTEQSARNNDPKPLYRTLDYQLSPTIGFSLNPYHALSLSGTYSSSNEHIETGYYADQNPILLSIRGYGEFSSGPVVTAERFRKGSGWQLRSGYRYKRASVTLLAELNAGTRTSDVNEGIGKPIFIGALEEQHAQLMLGAEEQGHTSGWRAYLRAWLRDGEGFDPVFNSVNPAYYLSGLSGKVSFFRQTGPGTWLSINLLPEVSYTNYFESVAKTDWTSVMLHTDASVTLNKSFNKRLSLLAEVLLGYHVNLQNSIVINRPTALSEILVRPDFRANSSDYIRTAGLLSAAYRSTKVGYMISLGFDLKTAPAVNRPYFRDRDQYHASFNFIF